ncbi:WD40 repeat domain-containing protein [Pyxidicoccus sp. MSG2]|uniref:WD40 repeat domain-containing protein n=1 Tax=Pyxidicoccus sp. MSG2 TaxID=2996790 RepID=UPI002271619A|nr:WD40 repeat domain-containing protein [Pyxidicoccus sp. MSG2]MCY1023789.1 WD40 repeat domain-containing protein [Pyxidicoccus sp. MSG2]
MSTSSRAASRERRLHGPSTKLTGHSTHIIAAEWSEDSSRLVSAASNDSTVRVWDVEAARTVSKLDIAKGVNNVRLSPTGDRLVATFDDKVARVYALTSGGELASARQGARTQALEVAPDGEVYWAGFGAGDDVVWSWRPGEEPKPLLNGIHTFEPHCGLSFSRDGTELWCFFEWDLVGFDTRTGAELARFKGDRDVALGTGFVLPPRRCAVAVKSHLNRDDEPVRPRLYKWDLESGRHDWSSEILRFGHGVRPLLAMARSTRWLATLGDDGVTLHSSRSGRVLGVLPCEVSAWDISCLSVSPDERFVAVGTANGDLVVHDVGDAVIEPGVAVPRIARRSRMGSPLLLRLQKRPGLWLRVHENGDLEKAEGDARTDSVITTPVLRAGQQRPVAVHPGYLASELCRRLWPHELSKPPPWSRAHPVQVFVGGELAVEGHVGIGSGEDILGIDSDPDGVGERVGGELGARKLLAGIEALLAWLPAD